MGDFYKHLIRNWVGNGGDNFLHYSLAGPWGAGGAWGMLQSIDQPSSVKYAAARRRWSVGARWAALKSWQP